MASGGASPFPPATRTATPLGPSPLNPNAAAASTTLRQTKICVYCGSSPGHNPAHMEAARQLARVMAANNIALGNPPPLPSLFSSHPSVTFKGHTCSAPQRT